MDILGLLAFVMVKEYEWPLFSILQTCFCQLMANSLADDLKHIFLLSFRNNCQWRFSSSDQIVVWLVVMLLFLCMPVDGVPIHQGRSLHLSCYFSGNWNTNIDSIVHALDMKFQARWSSVGLDPFAL